MSHRTQVESIIHEQSRDPGSCILSIRCDDDDMWYLRDQGTRSIRQLQRCIQRGKLDTHMDSEHHQYQRETQRDAKKHTYRQPRSSVLPYRFTSCCDAIHMFGAKGTIQKVERKSAIYAWTAVTVGAFYGWPQLDSSYLNVALQKSGNNVT